MQITVDREGTIAVLRCVGSLDMSSVPRFREVTQSLLAASVRRFVVDGSELTFIDSQGLGVLIALLRKVQAQDGDLKVAALTPDVASIFEITRLNRLFEVCSSREHACRRFTPAPGSSDL